MTEKNSFLRKEKSKKSGKGMGKKFAWKMI